MDSQSYPRQLSIRVRFPTAFPIALRFAHGITTQQLIHRKLSLLCPHGRPVKAVLAADLLDWDMRLLKEFKLGDRMRVLFSIEGFNFTRATNKQFSSDGESSFGNPQATVNPRTGLAFSSNTALIPTNSPGTDYFGGARQAQLGMRFVF